jgi:hypothetical protein
VAGKHDVAAGKHVVQLLALEEPFHNARRTRRAARKKKNFLHKRV